LAIWPNEQRVHQDHPLGHYCLVGRSQIGTNQNTLTLVHPKVSGFTILSIHYRKRVPPWTILQVWGGEVIDKDLSTLPNLRFSLSGAADPAFAAYLYRLSPFTVVLYPITGTSNKVQLDSEPPKRLLA
jgi:hypothetical protein